MDNNFFQTLLNFLAEILKLQSEAIKTFMEVSMTLYAFHHQEISASQKAAFRKQLSEAEKEVEDINTKIENIQKVIDPYYEALKKQDIDAQSTGDDRTPISILLSLVFEVRHAANRLKTDLIGKSSSYKNSYPTYLHFIETTETENGKHSLADLDDLPSV